jgi:hypothetical protein
MHIELRRVDWAYTSTFRIAGREQSTAETVWVELIDGAHIGRGEAMGVFYHGETVDSLWSQLADIKDVLIKGISRTQLLKLLPPGGVRNAVDCALSQMSLTSVEVWG